MRLFVGFLAPPELRRHITALLERVPHKPYGLKEITPESWHVTLTFLGEANETNLPELAIRLKRWSEQASKISLALKQFETFPIKHPRYLVGQFDVSIEKERFAKEVDRLREMLSVYVSDIDRKPWSPHMTLEKTTHRQRLPRWECAIEAIEWLPEGVSLVKSVSGPQGSEYTPIQTFPWIQKTT